MLATTERTGLAFASASALVSALASAFAVRPMPFSVLTRMPWHPSSPEMTSMMVLMMGWIHLICAFVVTLIDPLTVTPLH